MNMQLIEEALAEIRAGYRKQNMGRKLGYGKSPIVLVIDFQKCLADPTRDCGSDMSYEINNTRVLLNKAREKGIPILYTVTGYDADCFDGGLWTQKVPAVGEWKVGSKDLELVDELNWQEGEKIIVKKYCSSFLATGLASFLTAKGIDTIIITGCSTSGCIRASTTDAMCNGFRAILPRECINDRNPLTHEVNLMDMDTRFCDVVHMDEVLEYFDKF